MPRDRYYELFAKGRSAMAIEPVGSLRTLNLPENTLDTMGSKRSINARGRGPTVRYFDSRQSRKQHNYEILVDPAYRIDLYLSNDEAHNRLHRHLQAGTSVYTPSLGLSELLADVTFHDAYEGDDIEPVDRTAPGSDPVTVDSVLWEGSRFATPQRGTELHVERSQAFFAPAVDASGRLDRTAVGYVDVGYSPTTASLEASGTVFAHVSDRTVSFY
jgi:CRISPR-associated protein Cas5h